MGKRLALLRQRKGLSIRDVAARAGIDKNTVLRAERGSAVRMDTFRRICVALETTPGRQMLDLAEPHERFRVSRVSERRWETDPDLMCVLDPGAQIEELSVPSRRWELGWGGHSGFNGFLDCELFGGTVVSSVIELFASCTLRSFNGEELIYCLRGSLILHVGDDQVTLNAGDAVCLWAAQPHSCVPDPPLRVGQPPALILSVRTEGAVLPTISNRTRH